MSQSHMYERYRMDLSHMRRRADICLRVLERLEYHLSSLELQTFRFFCAALCTDGDDEAKKYLEEAAGTKRKCLLQALYRLVAGKKLHEDDIPLLQKFFLEVTQYCFREELHEAHVTHSFKRSRARY